MERWRWVPGRHGRVLRLGQRARVPHARRKNGNVIHTDEIIVGQPSWPTPVFSADMKTVVFRPELGRSRRHQVEGAGAAAAQELRRRGFFGIFGGGYSAQAVLDAYDLKAYANGRQVDPNSVDWSSVDIRRFSFQQPPGPKNVLGDVKFLFPNSHDVYMHDTPERNLFGKSFRALSHGCMRVHEPRRLAEVLLAEDKGWSADEGAEHVLQRRRGCARQAHPGARHLHDGARRRERQAADVRRFLRSRRPHGRRADRQVDPLRAAGLRRRRRRFRRSGGRLLAQQSQRRSRSSSSAARRSRRRAPPTLADAISGLFSP